MSMNRSTFEERQNNLSYLRTLYGYFFLENLISVIWTSCCLYWYKDSLGEWVGDKWWMFMIFAIIAVIILLICAF